MKQYKELLQHIIDNGDVRTDRTGVGTKGVFGHQMRFNLNDGFPLVTGKKTSFKNIAIELLWFLRGDTNIKYLQENGCRIWDEWADKNGDLGPVYGKQWRSWNSIILSATHEGNTKLGKAGYEMEQVITGPERHVFTKTIDQIQQAVDTLKKNPFSRRIIVSAWNPTDVADMALPPCHLLFQFFVSNDMKLSCQLYQRSADCFLGVPYNIASYALLTHMMAHVCGLGVGDFIWTGGDIHIYSNHIEQVQEYLSRPTFELPRLSIDTRIKTIDSFTLNSLTLSNYTCGEFIKADVAV